MSNSILYLGHTYGTSRHRADALARLGNTVEIFDPLNFFPNNKLLQKVIEKLVIEVGAAWFEPYIRQRLAVRLRGCHFSVVWSDQCLMVGLTTATVLRCHADHMVTYAIDDPFGTTDGHRFKLYLKALGVYDLVVVVRESNITEAYTHGARNVLRVLRSADEVAHHPLVLPPEKEKRWSSDVLFIGTWMPERGPFIRRLVELKIPLTLFGDRWQKAPEWPVIKRVWHGPGLLGDAYVKAIQKAKVCLGMLSKGNRDFHTSRSSEIPYIGSLLCAERTVEHMAMYCEDEEAVFWSTPDECADKCFALLSQESKRQAIAQSGHNRCIQSGYLNQPIMESILNTLLNQGLKAIRSESQLRKQQPGDAFC
ncbi:MAG: glycosyltransferase [Deltaproteobacteria bacterium]|nr:glycosyltransferase [Deltaproteobacteria bacterium]